VRDLDKVKTNKLFEILESKNIPNLTLKSMIEIYSGNKIKVRINIQLSEEHTISHSVRQGCPLSPTLCNNCINEIRVTWNQTYTKGITLSTTTKISTLLFADNQVT